MPGECEWARPAPAPCDRLCRVSLGDSAFNPGAAGGRQRFIGRGDRGVGILEPRARAMAKEPHGKTTDEGGMIAAPRPVLWARYLAARQKEPEDVPINSLVRTPTGQLARVVGYRGFRRDHRVRLVCRYEQPANRRYDVVLLAPELVHIVEAPKARGAPAEMAAAGGLADSQVESDSTAGSAA